MKMKASCGLLLLGLFAVMGCGNPGDEKKAANDGTSKDSTPQPIAELSETQSRQKEKAKNAQQQLFQSLLAELTKSMGENGVAKSISVCKQVAPQVAQQVSDETGVRIGRTSFQLRNPKNQPPTWAVSFVESKVEEDVCVELPNESLGVLSPIRLKETCALCHGTKEQVTPNVQAAILANYPEDQATGFQVGDIRGYFWVEVPSLSDESPDEKSP